jgi:endonuclease/exonuclease/phosphatase family metal-dependent hydrolase
MDRHERQFTVATWNLHAGVDGWGRPFDVVDACRSIDADVLVLQECWTPDADPAAGTAGTVADALGYTSVAHPLAAGRLAGPHPRASHRWMRPLDWRSSSHALYLDSHRPLPARVTGSARFSSAQPGSWGIAVLSRLPVAAHHVIDLGHLPKDRAGRAALVVAVTVGGRAVTVVGTHLSHLSYGSPVQYGRLRRRLEADIGNAPAVLAGDMNLWGPAVIGLLPRWRRTARGRTWPAWRPHSQVDHILVRGPVGMAGGGPLAVTVSDHRPLRAVLTLPDP